MKSEISRLIKDLQAVDSELALFCMLLVIAVIILDSLTEYAKRSRIAAGINPDVRNIFPKETRTLAQKSYVSEIQGIAGSPDGLLFENNQLVPIERKPLAKKLRDRYVAQLLVYMRLVEEFEGKRPPYGYLILGKNSRRIKVLNSEEKQAWLSQILIEMRAIVSKNQQPIPAPQKEKCRRCVVRDHCQYRVDI